MHFPACRQGKRILLAVLLLNGLLLTYHLSMHYYNAGQIALVQRMHAVGSGGGVDYGSGDSGVGGPGDNETANHLAVHRQLQVKRGTLRSVNEVSCSRLLAGDAAEQSRALHLAQSRPVPLDYRNDEFFAARGCAALTDGLVTETLSRDEADFPVAFSVMMFKEFFQAEKLLRAVYRPEHFYCLHVDAKSSEAFYQAAARYASCLPNVQMATPRQDVRWGQFSVLGAELVCMRQLLAMSSRWRYFINLTGQEFPLRTMRELVAILRAYNGANNVENAGPRDYVPSVSVPRAGGGQGTVRWIKGSVHVTVSRGFVEFAVGDIGRQISDHLHRNSIGRRVIPDELFFATLNNNPSVLKVPGADLSGLLTDNVKHPYYNRYKNWIFGLFGYPCRSGKIVRQICIWGVADLPVMNRRPELFVNKFYFDFQRFALECMEERFWNNTRADYGLSGFVKTHRISPASYGKYLFVQNHI